MMGKEPEIEEEFKAPIKRDVNHEQSKKVREAIKDLRVILSSNDLEQIINFCETELNLRRAL